jgi:protein-S-isoprenylcysteine O-methyltransferase Ste14
VKTASVYETAAALVTAIGILFLVGVYFPILNPDMYQISFHTRSFPSIAHYIIGTPIALLILAVGWHFNRKSEKLKKNGK